jgi:predicted lipid-binding transport protein (Tim44 family)
MAKMGLWGPGKAKQLSEPSEAALHETIREVFPAIQRAWTNRDLRVLADLTTDDYVARARPVIDKLDRKLQVNRIEDVQLCDAAVAPARADAGTKRADAYLAFVLRDWLEDLRNNDVIRGDPESLLAFVEHWSFAFDPERGWLLDRVRIVWEGTADSGDVQLCGLPPGRYWRPGGPANWNEWDGSAWSA